MLKRVLKRVPDRTSSAGCWVGGASEALLAAGAMLLAGRYLAGSGALVGAHGAPLRKVALSLGAGCGAAGYFVVARLHGRPARCATQQPPDAAVHTVCRFWPISFLAPSWLLAWATVWSCHMARWHIGRALTQFPDSYA